MRALLTGDITLAWLCAPANQDSVYLRGQTARDVHAGRRAGLRSADGPYADSAYSLDAFYLLQWCSVLTGDYSFLTDDYSVLTDDYSVLTDDYSVLTDNYSVHTDD